MTDEHAHMRQELEKLAQRVAALEARGVHEASERSGNGDTFPGALPPDTFWALEGLQARLEGEPGGTAGAVMLVGSLTLPGGAPVAWQQAAETKGLLESDWGDRAAVFGALAHPVRIELLRQILCGVHATADLAAIDGLGTTGQLHHHLRQLVAAGWVRQNGRGSYEIPAARIVPLLACVVGVER